MSKGPNNGSGTGNSGVNGNSGQGPATVTITGARLGAGDTHWWVLA